MTLISFHLLSVDFSYEVTYHSLRINAFTYICFSKAQQNIQLDFEASILFIKILRQKFGLLKDCDNG
jgi:hypothetical protein